MPTAPIAAIPTLFNTGQADGYSLLADGATDTHWGQLAVSPDPNWLVDGGPSRWVSPTSSRSNPVGDYAYSLTFAVPAAALVNGQVPRIFGRIACDDAITQITLNGQAVQNPDAQINSWKAFTIDASTGLVVGQNTLALSVQNAVAGSPTGLRVEWLSADAPNPPVTAPTLSAVGQLVNGTPTIFLQAS